MCECLSDTHSTLLQARTANRKSSSCIPGTGIETSPGTAPGWARWLRGGILGLLTLVALLRALTSRATIQWGLENRVGMKIGEGPKDQRKQNVLP